MASSENKKILIMPFQMQKTLQKQKHPNFHSQDHDSYYLLLRRHFFHQTKAKISDRKKNHPKSKGAKVEGDKIIKRSRKQQRKCFCPSACEAFFCVSEYFSTQFSVPFRWRHRPRGATSSPPPSKAEGKSLWLIFPSTSRTNGPGGVRRHRQRRRMAC